MDSEEIDILHASKHVSTGASPLLASEHLSSRLAAFEVFLTPFVGRE